MNTFYESIAPWYDEIFPYQPLQREFILGQCDGLPASQTLLDVGCGTGSLALALSGEFASVTGMDPDPAMLGLAEKKAMDLDSSARFLPAGMLQLREQFRASSLDMILCLGNTLVHLPDEARVSEMLVQSAEVLRPGGKLILQVINYDRILDQNLAGLPDIENDRVRFERFYEPSEKGVSHLVFRTVLTIKASGQVTEQQTTLLALRPATLCALLAGSGMEIQETFGSFSGLPFTQECQPFIVVAQKPCKSSSYE